MELRHKRVYLLGCFDFPPCLVPACDWQWHEGMAWRKPLSCKAKRRGEMHCLARVSPWRPCLMPACGRHWHEGMARRKPLPCKEKGCGAGRHGA
eukprot:1162106-Pelagomonas_calceolata.AAC.2